MKRSHKIALGVAAALGLGFGAATVIAQPGHAGGAMEMHAKGGMQHGAQGGMGHAAMSAEGHGPAAAQQLMTPEERQALREKMHNAATPEERQKLAETARAEMQKRAKEKGITLPQHSGAAQTH